MRATIQNISIAQVNTSRGPSDSYRFLMSDGRTYSSFFNQTIASWKLGDTVDFEFKQNGKYFNIVTLREGGASQSSSSPQILERLTNLETLVIDLKNFLVKTFSKSPPPTEIKKGESASPQGEIPLPTDDDAPPF